jgi:ATP-dependent helicase/nuclease subunit B
LSLRFILGRAGSGKTHLCLEEIRHRLRQAPDGPPLIFLVPEQATFQTEHALAVTPGFSGVMRAQVLSFRRLAWRVFSEVGGAARPHIGELGKRMLLTRILEHRRPDLRIFGRAARHFGFTETLVRALSEMKAYLIAPDDLERIGGWLTDTPDTHSLKAKVQDLKLVFEDFEARLVGSYLDPDDYLTLLAVRLGRSPMLRAAEVWVDGFAGFTPQEFRVLEALLCTVERVNVALCLDPHHVTGRGQGLFCLTETTLSRLTELARSSGVNLEAPVNLKGTGTRFKNHSGIAHLERKFFHRPTAVYAGDPGLKLVAAANRRAEVEGAAREIVRLCRERGYRWRDVSVVIRDLENYHELVATVFADYRIPYFIDRKRAVLHHPLIELLRSALEVVAGDWTYDPVFRYLKTDLVPVSRDEVDFLENYVLAHGIRGSRWTSNQDWGMRRSFITGADEPKDADQQWFEWLNRVRQRASHHLLAFQRGAEAAQSVRDLTETLYDLVAGLKVPERIEEWSRDAEAAGLLDTAREHRQIWDGVVQLFDQLVETLGDEHLTLDEYARLLESGMEGLQVALIPPALDQVLVGSLERSRNPEVRAAFVLGVSEGILPARHTAAGLFTDRERELLLAVGLEVAPDVRRRVYEEQYLVYIALTRSSHYLWVSYPLADDEGRALAPSSVIVRLRELFPRLEDEVLPIEPHGITAGADHSFVAVPERALSFLATRLRDWQTEHPVDPVWWSVYNWFCGRTDWSAKLALVRRGLFYHNREQPLDGELSSKLYGSPLVVSVSRIEKFQQCPFAHFVHYGLRLRERVVFKLAPPDLGQFLHAALKTFEDRLREDSLDWADLEAADCTRMASEVVDQLVPRFQSEILSSSSRHRFLAGKFGRIIESTTRAIATHARHGRFRPVAWEVPFGPEHSLPALVYPLPDGAVVELAGRIDRVDVAHSSSATYLRVVDYKLGGTELRLDNIFHGLNLQLLVYLEAGLTHAEKIVGHPCLIGGAFYFRVQNPLLREDAPVPPAEISLQLLKSFRMPGLVLEDPDLIRLMDASAGKESMILPAGFKKDGSLSRKPTVLKLERFNFLREHLTRVISATGQRIRAGEVAIAPYRKGQAYACQYCPYKPVCAFDPLIESNRYRQLWTLSNQEISNREELWRSLRAPEEGFRYRGRDR